MEQAGFRTGRSTCDQVLTTFIENGFQKQLKTGAVFLNLSAAYDTVWHTGLVVKVSRVLPRRAVEAVELLLRDRRFRVYMSNRASVWKRQTNGLPQGSVLAPTLFNLYTNDPPTDTVTRVHLGRRHLPWPPGEDIRRIGECPQRRYGQDGRILQQVASTAERIKDSL